MLASGGDRRPDLLGPERPLGNLCADGAFSADHGDVVGFQIFRHAYSGPGSARAWYARNSGSRPGARLNWLAKADMPTMSGIEHQPSQVCDYGGFVHDPEYNQGDEQNINGAHWRGYKAL